MTLVEGTLKARRVRTSDRRSTTISVGGPIAHSHPGQRAHLRHRHGRKGSRCHRTANLHLQPQLGGCRRKIFTISDPKTGRGDGEGFVIESLHRPSANEWRAAIRFPFSNNRGVMEGVWHRRGDELNITSRDEFQTPNGKNHVFPEFKLRRRLTAAVPGSMP